MNLFKHKFIGILLVIISIGFFGCATVKDDTSSTATSAVQKVNQLTITAVNSALGLNLGSGGNVSSINAAIVTSQDFTCNSVDNGNNNFDITCNDGQVTIDAKQISSYKHEYVVLFHTLQINLGGVDFDIRGRLVSNVDFTSGQFDQKITGYMTIHERGQSAIKIRIDYDNFNYHLSNGCTGNLEVNGDTYTIASDCNSLVTQ